MMDHLAGHVCSMCGDVGFPDKLFRCNKCRHRIQHSYCSNYYSEVAEPIEVCDWCQSEEMNNRSNTLSTKSSSKKLSTASSTSSELKQQDHHHHHGRHEQSSEKAGKGSGSGGVPSPRTSTRRYKLLKDVMC